MNIDIVPASADGPGQDLHPPHRNGPIKILIVDDEPKNLTVLETVLDDPDYRLVRAESADRALHALVMDEFALLILDIQLPDMTGFELAQMIKQRKKTAGVPIIFLTAYYNEDQHVLEGYGTGAVEYLVKPVNPAILRSKVAVFAELHRKRLALFAEVVERRRVEEQLRELNDTLEQRVVERTQALQIASAALHETGEQYRSLFEGSLDAIFFLDAEERFRAANPAALRFFARTIEELKTVHFLDLCPPGQRETVGNAFRSAFCRQGFTIDTAVIGIGGERRDLFISGAPEIHNGEVVGISCIARDITERIQTEKALCFSEARYRELIHALPAALYTTDRQGRITLYNQAAITLWGREPEVGKDLWCGSWRIYRPDGAPLPLDECPMAATLRQGRAITSEELIIERPDGTRRHVLPHPEPIYTDGVMVGAINILIDITDRKEAERAVADLAAIVTSSDDAIIGIDLRGIVTSWNGAAARLFGYTPEEMIGQSVLRLIPSDRQGEEGRILDQISQGKPINHYETIRRRKDGTELTVSLTVSPVFIGGRITGASKIIRDITEQKRVENALRHSERKLADFFDNATVGLHWVGPDGLIIKANNTELEMFGYSSEEYLGHHIAEFHVDQLAIHNILHRLSCGETLREYPARIRRKDGSILDVLINSSGLFEDGKYIHSRCFTRDVSDSKRAEQALLDSREELRHILEFKEAVVTSMTEGVYTVNDQGLVTSINQAAATYFGFSREELLGCKMHDVVHYKHPDGTPFPPEECAGLQVLRLGKALTNHEDVFIRKDGSFFDVVYSSSPLLTDSRIAGLVVVFRDISDRKRWENTILDRDLALTSANETLKKQTVALAEANKELEGFSYSVSHDLRAPLRTIDAFSRILEEDFGSHLNAEANRCLTIVRKAVAQAGELIDDLLEFSRLGRQGMKFSLVDMARLAREAADDLRAMQGSRKIDLTIGDLPICQGDPRFLKIVWTNLLSNAFKYTNIRNECRIEVGWMPDDASAETVTYYVKDDGVGFDMKYVHKLFGVFQRLHPREDFEGTGVGLAIVHRIVLRHGGRVRAEGKVDGGATFYFSLRRA
jgi:PAS domain S-box-containing protein